MENHDLIEQYINGSLQGRDLENFEAKLNADKDLARKVRFFKGLKNVQIDKKQMKSNNPSSPPISQDEFKNILANIHRQKQEAGFFEEVYNKALAEEQEKQMLPLRDSTQQNYQQLRYSDTIQNDTITVKAIGIETKNQELKTHKPIPKVVPIWRKLLIRGMIASLLILCGLAFWNQKPGLTGVSYASTYISKPLEFSLAILEDRTDNFGFGSNNSTQEQTQLIRLKEARNAYESEDYNKAIPLFEEYLKVNKKDNEIKFYLGKSYLLIEQISKAIEVLTGCNAKKTELIVKRNLNLAAAYILNKQKDKAIPLIEEALVSVTKLEIEVEDFKKAAKLLLKEAKQ